MVTLSIIVPVFNSELYIEKCIKSILNQTISNFELILINDGSTDSSGIICDKYKELDDRVVVIHKKNGGVSSARNSGLEKATGTYIGFVDSDDWIDNNMYENMYNKIIEYNCDLVTCNRICDDGDKIWALSYENNMLFDKDEFKNIYITNLLINNMGGFISTNLYKNSIIRDNNIRFDSYSLMEDLSFNIDYLKYCKKAYFIKDDLYFYRKTSNSLMSKVNEKSFKALYQVYLKKMEIINLRFNDNEEILNKVTLSYLQSLNFLLYKINLIDSTIDYKKKVLLDLIKNKEINDLLALSTNEKKLNMCKRAYNEKYNTIMIVSFFYCIKYKSKENIKKIIKCFKKE